MGRDAFALMSGQADEHRTAAHLWNGDWWMLKRPEIALGFLIATVFWIVVLGWATSYSPSEQEKNSCYQAAEKAGRTHEECKTFWERTTSDPIATFTLVLAISTIGLWVATIGLYVAGERHSERQLRAYVMIESVAITGIGDGQKPDIHITIKNSGQSPASHVTHWAKLGFSTFPEMSGPIPERNPNENLPESAMAPGGTVGIITGVDLALNGATIRAIQAETHALYVKGEIRYTDAFGKSRETDFLLFCTGHLANAGSAASYKTGNRIT